MLSATFNFNDNEKKRILLHNTHRKEYIMSTFVEAVANQEARTQNGMKALKCLR